MLLLLMMTIVAVVVVYVAAAVIVFQLICVVPTDSVAGFLISLLFLISTSAAEII